MLTFTSEKLWEFDFWRFNKCEQSKIGLFLGHRILYLYVQLYMRCDCDTIGLRLHEESENYQGMTAYATDRNGPQP